MDYSAYNVFLSQLKDGSVSFSIDYDGSTLVSGMRIEERQEDGKYIMYTYSETSRIRRYMQTPMPTYSFLTIESLDGLDEIRQGVPDEYAIVWQAGDSVSPASEEMETYFALWDQYTALWSPVDENGEIHSLTFEESQKKKALREQVDVALKAVPEWQ